MAEPAPHEALSRLRAFWDRDAATYDRSPGHAVSDAAEAAAWKAALLRHLPPPPARILDAGAGTGALSVLAAELGFAVTALDLSPGMLAHARRKSAERGLALETVVGPADDPPAGPFDAVMERHLMWTLPDPLAALRAWRDRAPRAVLFEGLWGRRDLVARIRRRASEALRRAYRMPEEHHAEYDPGLLATLPLATGIAPGPLLELAAAAGWERYSIERLRAVEAARRRSSRWPLGSLEAIPRFVLALAR